MPQRSELDFVKMQKKRALGQKKKTSKKKYERVDMLTEKIQGI